MDLAVKAQTYRGRVEESGFKRVDYIWDRIGFQVRYRIVMSAEMHKVNDRYGDAFSLHSTAEGIGQFPPWGSKKK